MRWTPPQVSPAIQETTCIKAAKVQRLWGRSNSRGQRCTISCSWAWASWAAGCSGKKSGLAPASRPDSQARCALGLITGNPVTDSLFAARLEQPVRGDLLDGDPGGHLEGGGGSFPNIGFGVMIAELKQFG